MLLGLLSLGEGIGMLFNISPQKKGVRKSNLPLERDVLYGYLPRWPAVAICKAGSGPHPSIGGSVVEFSPATREARVRFPANAVTRTSDQGVHVLDLADVILEVAFRSKIGS